MRSLDLAYAARAVRTSRKRIDSAAVGVRDGRIEYVGPRAELPRGTRIVELDGVIVAGLVDAHAHIVMFGAERSRLDLRDAASADDVASRVRGAPRTSGWVLGHSWDQTTWPGGALPAAGLLPGDVPVSLRRVDGHALWVNVSALRLAGVTADTPDPPGGRIVRDADGEPTGVLVDAAMQLVGVHVPRATREDKRAHLELGIRECQRVGLTGAHEMGATPGEAELVRESAHDLRFRMDVLLHDAGEQRPLRDGFCTVAAVKLFADGALGSSGAWLLEPYTDDPSSRGIPVTHGDELCENVRRAAAAGFGVAVHAIGDAAARDVLDAYEVVGADASRRFRIEHAQVVHPDDRRRMARMGVIASMQPTHCTSDMRYAESRLGPDRVAHAYSWRSMLRDGVPLALGSDVPVELPDPLHGLHAAVTRCNADGDPEGGWQPLERLTPLQALEGFTTGAAYAVFAEDTRGRIATGFDADLTVLGDDPVTADPASLRDLGVVATIVAGELVHRA